MTLAELRDPKQPLLRELAQRAPGTYTHSLNVAAIAEAAAERIGGDSLLTYVGALYHDIGKMSKPEYFVENQGGGPNRHDRLSPAMSLLIVVAHVKDGMELAREFRLPPRLQHFIEAHHGTTLVEYFYHRARAQALATAPRDAEGRPVEDDTYVPDELEFRYPGPKPRTKEVAILMIADAVESAARAMPEPSPAKIEQLVRSIAHKRLMDGQFDDCELTLRDLNLIVESIVRTLTSMHHVRIAYPEGPTRSGETRAGDSRAGDSRAGDSRAGEPAALPGAPPNAAQPPAERASPDPASGPKTQPF
jgi:putative nucleotidyltransferase with HDIG domain